MARRLSQLFHSNPGEASAEEPAAQEPQNSNQASPSSQQQADATTDQTHVDERSLVAEIRPALRAIVREVLAEERRVCDAAKQYQASALVEGLPLLPSIIRRLPVSLQLRIVSCIVKFHSITRSDNTLGGLSTEQLLQNATPGETVLTRDSLPEAVISDLDPEQVQVITSNTALLAFLEEANDKSPLNPRACIASRSLIPDFPLGSGSGSAPSSSTEPKPEPSSGAPAPGASSPGPSPNTSPAVTEDQAAIVAVVATEAAN